MSDAWQVLSNREWAIVVWGLILLVLAARMASEPLFAAVKQFVSPKIFGVFLGLALFVAGLVWLAARTSAWAPMLLKDVIVWYLTVGAVALFGAAQATEDNHYFRNLALRAFSATVLIEFLLDTYVLPFWLELIVVPVFFLLGGSLVIAQARREHRALRKPLATVIGLSTLVLISYAAYQAILSADDLFQISTLTQILISPILTLLSLPFLLAFALVVAYEAHFMRIDLWLNKAPKPMVRHAKWRSLATCRFSLPRLKKLTGQFYLDLQAAATKSEIARAIEEHACKPEPLQLDWAVLQTTLRPYTLPTTGGMAQEVRIDWQNLSDKFVRHAVADILPYDADGEPLGSGAKDYCIFLARDEQSKVPPNGIRRQSEGAGFILLSAVYGEASRVDVVVRLFENSR